MKLFERIIRVHLSRLLLAVLTISICICVYFYYVGDEKSKVTLLLGGLGASLIVALIQFLLSWNEHLEIEQIKKIGVKRVLPHRDDEEFYRGLIKEGKNRIWVMGVTALRFMQDFGDDQRGRPEKRVLIDALQRNVAIRILVPKFGHLKGPNDTKLRESNSHLIRLKGTHGNFQVKYFDHIPAHSIVVVDDMCLLGPVFPDLASKDSPCI